MKQRSALSRRYFCRYMAACPMAFVGPALHADGLLGKILGGGNTKKIHLDDAPPSLDRYTKEAYDYVSTEKGVKCTLCPNYCELPDRARSKCLVRVNHVNKLHSLVYGNPSAMHLDPVEKKPLYHFYPSTWTFSLGFAGCNLGCLNCQNWELSQKRPEELRHYPLFPADAVSTAVRKGCKSIAYTYNEAGVVYEYMYDTAKAARAKGLKNIWVTNGYMNQEPLKRLVGVIDAANVDLKAFSDETYQKLNFGRLQPVLDSLVTLKKLDVWIEITTLLVPTWTDDPEMVRKLSVWIVKELGADVPLHLSRFHPSYKLTNLPPTSPGRLIAARQAAEAEGMHYVYIGNYRVPDGSGSDTICPGCKKTVIKRNGFQVTSKVMSKGKCSKCGRDIAGRWD